MVALGLVGWFAGAGTAHPANRSALDVRPVIVIRSPRPGTTVVPPWPVRYAISGVKVAAAQPIVIRVTVAGQERMIDVTAKRQVGVVHVPDDRFFSGRRTVTFTLLRDDGAAYANPGARYTVARLTIAGNR